MAKRKSVDNIDDYFEAAGCNQKASMIFGVLYVQIGCRFPFPKKIWARRYCTIANDELIIAKSKETLEKKSNIRCNLRIARGFKVLQSTTRTGRKLYTKSSEIHTPLLEITDSKGKKIRLNLANEDELNYWTEPLNRIFYKNYAVPVEDEFGEVDAVALESDVDSDRWRRRNSAAPPPSDLLRDVRQRVVSEVHGQSLAMRVQMLRARRDELKRSLTVPDSSAKNTDDNDNIDDHEYCTLELNPDEAIKIDHPKEESNYIELAESRSPDDGFCEEIHESTEGHTYHSEFDQCRTVNCCRSKKSSLKHNTTTVHSSPKACQPDNQSEVDRESRPDSKPTSPLITPAIFSVPLYPIPFTKIDKPATVRCQPTSANYDISNGLCHSVRYNGPSHRSCWSEASDDAEVQCTRYQDAYDCKILGAKAYEKYDENTYVFGGSTYKNRNVRDKNRSANDEAQCSLQRSRHGVARGVLSRPRATLESCPPPEHVTLKSDDNSDVKTLADMSSPLAGDERTVAVAVHKNHLIQAIPSHDGGSDGGFRNRNNIAAFSTDKKTAVEDKATAGDEKPYVSPFITDSLPKHGPFFTSTPSLRQGPPPYRATVEQFRAAEPRRVKFCSVTYSDPTETTAALKQVADGSANANSHGLETFDGNGYGALNDNESKTVNGSLRNRIHLSPVSYVYRPLSITCKLCRNDASSGDRTF